MQFLILGTFVGVLAIIYGVYWLFIVRDEEKSKTHLTKRLRAVLGTVARRPVLTIEEDRLSSIGPIDRLLAKRASIFAPLERLLEQADSRLTVGSFLLMCGTSAAAAYLLVVWISTYRGIGVVVAIFAAMIPLSIVRWQRTRRIIKFEEKFPEAIDLIARALRAGHAFTTGLSMVSDEIPDPVGSEFKLLYDRQNFGMPLPQALRSFAERIPLIDARFFATAVLTQREAGGNLSEVLENLAKVVRERFKVKRQVRVVSAHGRITGWILVALPPCTVAGFMIVQPDHIKVLVQDPLGIKMVVTALVLQVLGALIIRKLVDIEY